MLVVNIHEAKTHLSRLLERVRLGEEVVIAKAGRPIARLTPIEQPRTARQPGSAKGQFTMSPDFDAPLPDDLLAEFER
jgi:prevent-host-death family protein